MQEEVVRQLIENNTRSIQATNEAVAKLTQAVLGVTEQNQCHSLNDRLPELPNYRLRQGSPLDRALLCKFMQRTYGELFPDQNLSHLAETVEQYLSNKTPLWWVDLAQMSQMDTSQADPDAGNTGLVHRNHRRSIACLWMGIAVDQVRGDRHSHIFLIYVDPAHRRQGIGRYLLQQAESWAKGQGDRQITLQVFGNNQPALQLYKNLGYELQALSLVKSLGDN